MMTKTTQRLVARFGCGPCRYFRIPMEGGRGAKTSCVHPRVRKAPIRYLKRCPKGSF